VCAKLVGRPLGKGDGMDIFGGEDWKL